MKILSSILLVSSGLLMNGLLHAQEITAKTAEPVVNTIPAPGTKPALAPTLVAEPKTFSKEQAEQKQSTPTPVSVTDKKQVPEKAVPNLKLADEKVLVPTGIDNQNTMKGTTKKPKSGGETGSQLQAPKPVVPAAPVALKTGQNNDQ